MADPIDPIYPRAGTGSIDYEDVLVKTPVKIEKKDGKPATASRIYLPAEWAGRHVVCMLLKDKTMCLPKFTHITFLTQKEKDNLPAEVKEAINKTYSRPAHDKKKSD